MRRNQRSHAIEATRLLNDFIGDLVIGTRALEWLDAPAIRPTVTREFRVTMNRMCVWHVIATLSKWQEVYDCYNQLFTEDVREATRSLRKELDKRAVRDFRNTVIGHILDKKTKKPLAGTGIDGKLSRVFVGDMDTFLRWVNNPADNTFPKTVVGIVEHVRDRLKQHFAITDQELFPWMYGKVAV